MKSQFTALAAVLAATVLFVACSRKTPVEKQTATREMPFDELLVFLPKEAVSIAKESHGIVLDFSPASVERVEMILGRLHQEYKKRGTTEGQRGLALAFGVYIGEVIRKHAGEGRWAQDHPQMGEGAMPLYWKGYTSFPVAWCLKRLANGEEDNVWLKYRHFVDERLKTG